jgi:antitoxin component YwqK of YwqJK toxin-antitoxin module
VNKADGEPDGLGILVDPSKSMHVGYFRNGERHGPYIHFFLTGWVYGTCDYDNYVGKEETFYMDGTTKSIDYDTETYYQQSRCTLF